jgi:N-acetylmuramic acid 6-phosphate etherase
MTQSSSDLAAAEFLKTAYLYKLGMLPTESQHPLTMNLSDQAQHDLPGAIALIKKIDLHALAVLGSRIDLLARMQSDVMQVLKSGHRIFLCGCGATGRLSLSLEAIWREQTPAAFSADQVISFMAGGDVAMVRSIENFEDHPEFGRRQLEELGFTQDDLLISCTEGGETPFVIGATEHAAEVSRYAPYFLFCNPIPVLKDNVERSRTVLENPRIHSIDFPIGPMVLSGSTRLQASTVLMAAVALAMFEKQGAEEISEALERLLSFIQATDFEFLTPFIERETDVLQRGDYIYYCTRGYEMPVLTDTTERHPTFSVPAFENANETAPVHSSVYLIVDSAEDSRQAWEYVLQRAPRPLDWEGYLERVGTRQLLGFDFSTATVERRKRQIPDRAHFDFHIRRKGQALSFQFDGLNQETPLSGVPLWVEHILLKLLLNIHSTLVMGRLGRYESNVMTWVRPSNGKLIDRSIRYVEYLLKSKDLPTFSYEEICYALFECFERAKMTDPVVLMTFEELKNRLPQTS